MGIRAALALAGAVALAGCAFPYAPAPVATNFPNTAQGKVQAVAHWDAIARHMVRELSPTLQVNSRRPLYVSAKQNSAFDQAVVTQLTTALVNQGYVVAKKPEHDALMVELETQMVAFHAKRPQYRFAGERSLLVEGVWVLTAIEQSAAFLASAAIVGHDAYSWFHSHFASGPTPKTEILATLSVSDDQRYYARTTSAYYTSDSDRSLYDAAFQPTKTFAVRDR